MVEWSDADEGAEVIFCRYEQCADRSPPCPSCVTLITDGKGNIMEPWQTRVIEEKKDLDAKIVRLKVALETMALESPQRDLMNQQLAHMSAYSVILKVRISEFTSR